MFKKILALLLGLVLACTCLASCVDDYQGSGGIYNDNYGAID